MVNCTKWAKTIDCQDNNPYNNRNTYGDGRTHERPSGGHFVTKIMQRKTLDA
jgi:hypothetical protein